jgi:hypothetical protein
VYAAPMAAPSQPRDGLLRRVGHPIALTVAGLGLWIGPASVGMAPSTSAAVADPDRWMLRCFAIIAVGLVGLVAARLLRPWHQRPSQELMGGVIGWLAWVFGAMLFGSGGMLMGLGLMFFGAWVLGRRRRRKRALCESELARTAGQEP